MLSEGFWRREVRSGNRTDDRTIVLDGRRHTVIGIMPASFQFPYRATPTDLWVPTELPRTDNRFQRIDVAVGRLSPGVTLEGAATEFRAIGEGLGPLSQSNPPRSVAMTPLTESVVGRSRRGVLIVFAAAAVVLLIACANVASLLLARAEARRREVAVRKALGASTGLLIRQFLAESLLLALAASAAALFIANAGTRALVWITAARFRVRSKSASTGRRLVSCSRPAFAPASSSDSSRFCTPSNPMSAARCTGLAIAAPQAGHR